MKKMLLHSCCAPCSTQVIDVLRKDFDLTIFYFNPNIYPKEEYIKRLEEQKKYAKVVGINVIDGDYDEGEFLKFVKGLEIEIEGGIRCSKCFEMRLRETAKVAKMGNFDIFSTTLSVSPHKNSKKINEIGEMISAEEGVEFYPGDFKKQDGYKKSIELSKRYELYRQNYCGCRFSKRG